MVHGQSVKRIAALIGAFLSITVCLADSRRPSSPCPDFFEYDHHRGGQWFGVILMPENLYASQMTVVVGLSIRAYVPQEYYGYIELLGGRREAIEEMRRGEPIMYKVIFPLVDAIPKVTDITFNGQLYCRGDPVPWTPDGYITNYKLQYVLNVADDTLQSARVQPWRTSPYRQGLLPQSPQQTFDLPQGLSPAYGTDTYIAGGYAQNQKQLRTNSKVRQPPIYQPDYQPAKAEPQVHYGSPALQDGDFHCGMIYSNALYIKGTKTNKGDWPWLVAIYVKKVTSLDFRCAGTLVSHKHIITAAHCVHDAANHPLSEHNLLIKVGVFNLQDWADTDVKQFGVSKISKDPKYTGGPNHHNDIAVLALDKSVAYNNYIIPACIWNMAIDLNKIVGLNGTVIGWGRDEFGLVTTPEPREGKVPIVSTETCRSSLEQFSRLTSDTTLCAGARDGTGPCNGDSGGGLFLNLHNRWYLRAIVSMSIPGSDTPCNLNEYVVYTDTAKYLPWINSIINST